MSEEIEVLKIVTQRLDKANIVYMISGSMAANYYTTPRMTRDIDVVVELKSSDVDKFVSFFQDGFYINREVIKKEILHQGMFNLIYNRYVVKVDFIIKKDAPYPESAFSHRRKVLIDDASMWFISPEDLIISKLNWAKTSHSEMQLTDVGNLMESVRGLDLTYIKDWIKKLNLEEVYKRVKL